MRKLFAALLGAATFLSCAAHAAGFNLNLMGGAAFDTTTPIMGTGSLGAGFGTVPVPSLQYPATLEARVRVPASTAVGATRVAAGLTAIWVGMDTSGNATATVNSTALTSSVKLNDGNPHLLEVDAAPSTATFFVDGNPVSTVSLSSPPAPGGAFAIGTYANGAPQFQWVGDVDEVALWTSVRHTAAYAVPSQPYTGLEGMSALWHLDNDGGLDYAGGTAIAPNDPSIAYDGGGDVVWHVTAAGAATVNAGNRVRTTFTGPGAVLTFNVAADAAPLPQIWYSVDGAPRVQATIAAQVPLVMPAATAAWPKHTVQWGVKSTSEFVERWTPVAAALAPASAVVSTGLLIPVGTATGAPAARAGRPVLFLGDSITEGYHTVSGAGYGQTDTNGSDADMSWVAQLGDGIGFLPINIGFGGTGLAHVGQGNVPVTGTSFNQLWSGQPRSFVGLAGCVINLGTNDGGMPGPAFQLAYQQLLQQLLAVMPAGTPIVAMRPFGGIHWVDIQQAVAAVNNARVTTLDTTGFFDPTLSFDQVHPYGVANALIGPQVTALLKPKLAPAPVYYPWSHN